MSTPEQQAELKRIESTFYGIPLTDDVVEQIADYTLAEMDAMDPRAIVKRARLVLTPDPVTATEQSIHLHVIIPTCCKPDQMEGLARDVARSLYYSIGGGVQVVYGGVRQVNDGVEVTFDPGARRGNAVSP